MSRVWSNSRHISTDMTTYVQYKLSSNMSFCVSYVLLIIILLPSKIRFKMRKVIILLISRRQGFCGTDYQLFRVESFCRFFINYNVYGNRLDLSVRRSRTIQRLFCLFALSSALEKLALNCALLELQPSTNYERVSFHQTRQC